MKGEITSQQEKNINLKKQIQASENMLQKLEKEKKSVLESVRNAEKSLKVQPVAKIENAKNPPPLIYIKTVHCLFPLPRIKFM